MALSGTYAFDPNLGEITIAAFARIGLRRPEITQQHLADAKFEANLLQTDMQGDGIQLYQVVLETLDIEAGRSAYPIDPMVVFMLDVYVRQNAQPFGMSWVNDNAVRERWNSNTGSPIPWGPSLGYDPYALFINQIVYWANSNSALSGWSNSGGSTLSWTGVTVPQEIAPVPPSIIPQSNFATDRILTPLSRSDYAATANKNQGGFPTSFWYDKLLQPTMYLWPVPTQFIPDGLQFYVMKRPLMADLADGTQVQIPYEYYDYYVWGLAERLAYIYAPDRIQVVSPRKQQAWQRAMQASTENVPINLDPMMGSYFRVG